ncbi:ParM/StbA family protein [Paraburkholderia hospita]|uniref:ParM/StbA family protein n=1 Tax=Paraburkholderia hospita TaxID=169430 RepID=UPI000B343F9D|nr:ParM/StbA family protein [Paraburkholderia hospita]OUL89766.1 hypothetical protein CA603_18195 [Paraburkholderia hospita]
MKTVAAIEVGEGNVKGISIDGNGVVKRFLFPSAVRLEAHGALTSFRSSHEANRHELFPVIDGTLFCVSTRPNQTVPDHRRSTPNDDFQVSKAHDALLASALHMTGLDRVDVLVVGTPLQTYERHAGRLKKLTGLLDFGLGRGIEVVRTLVLPQTFGSLLAAKSDHIIEREEHINHCVIDPGYFSTDVLTTKGLVIDDVRSFGFASGTAAVYQRIADVIASELRMPVSDLDRIEYALRSSTTYFAHGRNINLGPYLQKVEPHIEALVTDIYGRLGGTEDISSILLSGGGSALYERAVRKVFRSSRVILMPDPIHANARGYLIAGQAATL